MRYSIAEHQCRNCGGVTTSKYHYCHQTKECRQLRSLVQNNTLRPNKNKNVQCLYPMCTGLTHSKYGYCGKTVECARLYYQAKRAAKKEMLNAT